MNGTELLRVLHATADAVSVALGACDDWGPSGQKAGQYSSDLAADAAALTVLDEAGLGVLSEESGLSGVGRDVVVVVDPLDGSTNASRRVSWWATSLCAVDADGPVAAVVGDLVSGVRYEAVRGGGARLAAGFDASGAGAGVAVGRSLSPSGQRELSDAIVGLSGLPPRNLGWRQFRALGASALDLCAVADGRLDGFIDCSFDAHGVWDYAGAMLICAEAGAVMVDALGRELVVLEHAARRTPVAAATEDLLEEILRARRNAGMDGGGAS